MAGISRSERELQLKPLIALLEQKAGTSMAHAHELSGELGERAVSDDSVDQSVAEYGHARSAIDMERHQQAGRRVLDALNRVRKGVYGICVDCEKRIPIARLEHLPEAERCVGCQQEAEANEGY
jgi:RNA polymerase-binding transcription factor DksA